MNNDEIEKKLSNHDAWIVHMRDILDEITALVQAIARAGGEAGKRIAELATAQQETAKAQQKTEALLQKLIQSRMSNGSAE